MILKIKPYMKRLWFIKKDWILIRSVIKIPSVLNAFLPNNKLLSWIELQMDGVLAIIPPILSNNNDLYTI